MGSVEMCVKQIISRIGIHEASIIIYEERVGKKSTYGVTLWTDTQWTYFADCEDNSQRKFTKKFDDLNADWHIQIDESDHLVHVYIKLKERFTKP